MFLKVLQTLLCYLVVCVFAFEDLIYVYGQVSQEMIEQGRRQYQLLQERGNLPQYGNCWKSAVEHVQEGCRNLSEESQSDVALHMTNCFLEMSGHETYNCELDKKPNLKGICIRSMTDRAFHVYTEFYTHTQNICWFLRGQVWYETITENTFLVGKQLESSAKIQEQILKSQHESLTLQEKLLHYGQNLERTMEDFYVSTKQHQEVLTVMSTSLRSLQSWLVGEIPWVDLIVFYIAAAILIMVFTSSNRTASARLPIWFLLVVNAIIERLICAVMSKAGNGDFHLVHDEMYKYIWWSRKLFVAAAIFILIYKACCYRDMIHINNSLLQKIYDQNVKISETLQKMKTRSNEHNSINGYVSFLNESSLYKKPDQDLPKYNGNLTESYKVKNYLKETVETQTKKKVLTNGDINILNNALRTHKTEEPKIHKYNVPFSRPISGRQRISPIADYQSSGRYNLRSRHGTPDSNI